MKLIDGMITKGTTIFTATYHGKYELCNFVDKLVQA